MDLSKKKLMSSKLFKTNITYIFVSMTKIYFKCMSLKEIKDNK